MKNGVVWVITLLLLGALMVLVIMNASNASTVFGSVFQGFGSWATILSGSGYQAASTQKKKKG